MKKIILFTLVFTTQFINNVNAQLNKGVWLVGGTGSFLSSKYETSGPILSYTSKKLDINASPNVGYFIIDKLALGLKTSYIKFLDDVNEGGYSNENRLTIGSFARYYFLEKDKRYNILTEIGYQSGWYWFKPRKGKINTFSANVGSVIYLNTSVGFEFLVGYYSWKEKIYDSYRKQNGIQIGIGFQIHLEN